MSACPFLQRRALSCAFSIGRGWSDRRPANFITRRAGPDDPSGVPQIVERVEKGLGFRAQIDTYLANAEDNAYATIANGRRILVVDVGFLAKLNRIARTERGAIQVIARDRSP